MSADDVTVVWVSPGGAAESQALAAWARTRGLHLVAPREPAASPAVDLEAGDRVDELLARAKDALDALDAETAEVALARAGDILAAHPELPSAAWLRAEVERAWAARFARVAPRDEAFARAALRQAEALAGRRAAGIGEPPLSNADAPPAAPAQLTLRGGRGRPITVYVDGERVAPGAGDAFTLGDKLPGEHQLVVTSDGLPLYAAWVALPGSVEIQLPAPSDARTCDARAFAHVARAGGGVRADGIRCPRWVAAVPADGPGASILVARCVEDTCGPLLEWGRQELLGNGPPQTIPVRAPWPAWATWTLVGLGAATATAVALVATGALETRPVETRFVSGGVRVESYR